MATSTALLALLKKNPVTDGADTFNFDIILNNNWDILESWALKNDILKLTSKSANATLTNLERGIVGVTTGASNITITLPSAVTTQISYLIKKIDSGVGSVIISTSLSQLIDGVATKTIIFQNDYIQVVSDGTGWQIVDGTVITTQTAGNNSTRPASTAYADAGDALKVNNTTFNSHLADYTLQIPYVVSAGSANAYTATLTPALTAYTAGVALSVNINITNTGASTINVNGLGVKNILTSKGVAMTAGKLTAAGVYTLRYDGTNFILQGEGASGNALASDLLSGKSADSDAGSLVGTIPVVAGGNTITPSGSAQTAIAATTYTTAAISVAAVVVPVSNVLAGTTIAGQAGAMPENGALNYNPSTAAQNIPAGHTTGGTVNPVGGSAGAADVASGATFSSASGINQTGTGTNAKKYASGTATSSAATMNFTDELNSVNTVAALNVTGLNFPTGIAAIRIGTGIAAENTWYFNVLSTPNSKIFMSSGAGFMRLTGNATVSTTSFQMPVSGVSKSFTWEAWGL